MTAKRVAIDQKYHNEGGKKKQRKKKENREDGLGCLGKQYLKIQELVIPYRKYILNIISKVISVQLLNCLNKLCYTLAWLKSTIKYVQINILRTLLVTAFQNAKSFGFTKSWTKNSCARSMPKFHKLPNRNSCQQIIPINQRSHRIPFENSGGLTHVENKLMRFLKLSLTNNLIPMMYLKTFTLIPCCTNPLIKEFQIAESLWHLYTLDPLKTSTARPQLSHLEYKCVNNCNHLPITSICFKFHTKILNMHLSAMHKRKEHAESKTTFWYILTCFILSGGKNNNSKHRLCSSLLKTYIPIDGSFVVDLSFFKGLTIRVCQDNVVGHTSRRIKGDTH